MLEGSIAFTLSGATNSKFKALFSVWLPGLSIQQTFKSNGKLQVKDSEVFCKSYL